MGGFCAFYSRMLARGKNLAALLDLIYCRVVLLAGESLLDRICNCSCLCFVLSVLRVVLAAAGVAYTLLQEEEAIAFPDGPAAVLRRRGLAGDPGYRF